MAFLAPEHSDDALTDPVLELGDLSPATEEDSLINTRGTSLNYTTHFVRTGGPFCADRDSMRGDEEPT